MNRKGRGQVAKGKVRTPNRSNAARGIILSAVLEAAGFVIGAIVITALVYAGKVEEASAKYMAITAVGLNSFLGTALAVKRVKDQLWVQIAGSSAILYVVLLCVNAALFDGHYPGIGWVTLSFLAGVLLALALKYAGATPRKKGSYKYRYR
jgi:hypothetical protein